MSSSNNNTNNNNNNPICDSCADVIKTVGVCFKCADQMRKEFEEQEAIIAWLMIRSPYDSIGEVLACMRAEKIRKNRNKTILKRSGTESETEENKKSKTQQE